MNRMADGMGEGVDVAAGDKVKQQLPASHAKIIFNVNNNAPLLVANAKLLFLKIFLENS